MATLGTFEEQVRDRSPDWKGKLQKKFRFRYFRFEFGRYCYVVHPVEGVRDFIWWEWMNK